MSCTPEDFANAISAVIQIANQKENVIKHI